MISRTTSASIATDTASPMPNCLTTGSPLSTKLKKTANMIVAAAAISPAGVDQARP